MESLQDPLTSVRAAFAIKVCRLMTFLCNAYGGARRASKYAAVLALGAMDPVESNRKTAYTALQEFVAIRRAVLERQAFSAATSTSTSAARVHEQPEFILPYLVQVADCYSTFPFVIFYSKTVFPCEF